MQSEVMQGLFCGIKIGYLLGRSQAAKTQDFGSCIRRFESSRPSQNEQE